MLKQWFQNARHVFSAEAIVVGNPEGIYFRSNFIKAVKCFFPTFIGGDAGVPSVAFHKFKTLFLGDSLQGIQIGVGSAILSIFVNHS
ncbi:hypothetical protein ES703_112587 [subsurface metagenome]